jgi:hypothetical protein
LGEKSADGGGQCRCGNESGIGNEVADNVRRVGIAGTCLYLADHELYANGKIIDGVLHGDLIIKGYGDPKAGSGEFLAVDSSPAQTGLHEIKGNLMLDHYAL